MNGMHVAGRLPAVAAPAAAPNGLGLKSSSSSNSSPTSPLHSQLPQLTAHRPPLPPVSGRKRTADGAFDGGPTDQQSPDSAEGFDDREEGRIGVKRACNECRQQKVSHDQTLRLCVAAVPVALSFRLYLGASLRLVVL